MIRAGRIGKRSEDIEYGTEAELLSDRTYIFHGSMVLLCEEKAKSHVFKELSALLGFKVYICPESLKAVGSSRK